jgi:hypothetical protein
MFVSCHLSLFFSDCKVINFTAVGGSGLFSFCPALRAVLFFGAFFRRNIRRFFFFEADFFGLFSGCFRGFFSFLFLLFSALVLGGFCPFQTCPNSSGAGCGKKRREKRRKTLTVKGLKRILLNC